MFIRKEVMGVLNTNVYFLEFENDIVVIDPATDGEKIFETAKRIGKPICNVLLTHGHFDHCNAAAFLASKGARIYLSKADSEMIAAELDLARFMGEHLNKFKVDEFLTEGKLNVGGHIFDVLETGGHTAGSMSFVIERNIFCGDTLFYLGVGRSDLPTGDKRKLTESIKKLYALDGNYNVYPGHGQSTELDFERANNPYVKDKQ